MSPIDVERARTDTPGCGGDDPVVHLNNAGSSLPTRVVVETVKRYLDDEAMLGGYETQDAWAEVLAAVPASAARLLGCAPSEVAITQNASEAWWRAFSSIPLRPGDRVVVGRAEFVSAAAGLFQAAQRGVELSFVGSTEAGLLDLDALDRALSEASDDGKPPAAVFLTEVPMTQGVVNPMAEAVEICRAAAPEAVIVVDGTQTVGQLPVDVTAMGCDFYTATGRKWLRAPRGTGLLYVSDRVAPSGPADGAAPGDRLAPPVFVDGVAGAWDADLGYTPLPGAAGFGFGERSMAGVAGLGAAIDYALDLGLDAIAERIGVVAGYARQRLAAVDGVTVHDGPEPVGGIVTITVDGPDGMMAPADLLGPLRAQRIHVAPPGRATSYHNLADRGLDGVIRVAPHYYNTTDEIDRLAEALTQLAAGAEPGAGQDPGMEA